MRIDSHQHFWNYDPEQYDWMDERHENIRKDFLPSDLKPLLKENQFDGCIAVQARQLLEETEWLLKLAIENNIIKGIVGWVDLCSKNIEQVLERFAATNPILKGFRHVVHDEADDRFMLRKDFQQGISLLNQYNYTYDLLLFPRHLKVADQLISQFPEQRFVLNHIGKPDIVNRQIEPWKEDVYQLALNRNVYCKLSGMVTQTHLNNWRENDFYSYLDIIFDAFGPERLMIGSDWPVSLLSGSYSSVMNIVIRYLSKHPSSIQEAILGENCSRFYKL